MTATKLPIRPSGKLLAQNTVFNLLGGSLPILAALITIPLLIAKLGVDRFGILMLVWTVVNYTAVFDFGLGRATTRFIAHHGAAGSDDRIPGIVWTSVLATFVVGAIGGTAIAALTPWLTSTVFHIPEALTGEADRAFHWLAVFVPVILVTAPIRGILDAYQRFDLINLVQSPGSIANYIVPLMVSVMTRDVGAVVFSLMLVRSVVLGAFLMLALRTVPALRRPTIDRHFVEVLKFGGWLTVSGIVSPTMESADRFLIGALLPLSAVTYYTTPYSMVAQIHMLSASLVTVLFPAFSSLAATGDNRDTARLYLRGIKYMFLMVAPVVLVFVVLARDVMSLWVGPEFAVQSHMVMSILALGFFAGALARVPFAMIQAAGRPDVTARFHVFEVVPFLAVLWLSIRWFGLPGAAVAWTVRVVVDAALLYGFTGRAFEGLRPAWRLTGLLVFVWMGVALFSFTTAQFVPVLWGRLLLILSVLTGSAGVAWLRLLDGTDRAFIARWAHRMWGMISRDVGRRA